jgi:transposase
MKNKYVSRAKIDENQFKTIVQMFALDLDASQISKVTETNRNTINRYIREIRIRISEHCETESDSCRIDMPENEMEQKYPILTVASDELLLLGVMQDGGKIRSRLLPETACRKIKDALLQRKRDKGYFFDDVPKQFNGLIDLFTMKYVKLKQRENKADLQRNETDICSGFWGFTRSRLFQFRGLKKEMLLLHIRECEFRYNNNRNDLAAILLQWFEERPLFN